MPGLNEPRTIPYAFRVVEIDHDVYLFDDSTRTFPCTTRAHIYAEWLYSKCDSENCRGGDNVHCNCNNHVEAPAMFLASTVEKRESIPVHMEDDDIAIDVPEVDAWDAAREEAHANWII